MGSTTAKIQFFVFHHYLFIKDHKTKKEYDEVIHSYALYCFTLVPISYQRT